MTWCMYTAWSNIHTSIKMTLSTHSHRQRVLCTQSEWRAVTIGCWPIQTGHEGFVYKVNEEQWRSMACWPIQTGNEGYVYKVKEEQWRPLACRWTHSVKAMSPMCTCAKWMQRTDDRWLVDPFRQCAQWASPQRIVCNTVLKASKAV